MIYEILEILKMSHDDIGSLDTFLELVLYSIEEKANQYEKASNYNNRVILENYIIIFMILTINLKNIPLFIRTVYKGENDFFYKVLDVLIKLKDKNIFLSIINNIYLEDYKCIFFKKNRDIDLEELYEEEKNVFKDYYSEEKQNEKIDIESYKQLYSTILKFDIDYNNFFPENSEDKIDLDEKSAYKLTIVQSLIRIIFSNEKKKYTQEKFYGFKVIKRIIDKDVEETIEKFGDQYKTLFRKEDLCDDFLKYIFFIFGNKMMVESFVNPIRKELRKLGFNNRDINEKEFDNFVTTFITNLNNTLPNVLKVLLKLLYESVKSHFTIEEDNYGPLYTTLIFNFFISPRVQAIFNINSQKNAFVRSLNRVLRNACFNFKFSDADPLSKFNNIIESNHLKIKNYIKDNIIGIDTDNEEIKESLEEIFNDEDSIFPKFLFYSDIKLLDNSIKGGINNYLKSTEIKGENNDWVLL